jgi:hypothetical protein
MAFFLHYDGLKAWQKCIYADHRVSVLQRPMDAICSQGAKHAEQGMN